MILENGRLSVTPTDLRPVEQEVLAALGGSSMNWFGRAATALYWTYHAAKLAGDQMSGVPEVILPAVSCTTPATAALAAGFRVRFADVDPETGLMTLETVQERRTSATRIVVFVNLFGQAVDLHPLVAWCQRHNIFLIEDLAQSQGAKLPNGEPAGSVGDAAVFSFNRTKILDCGGGALVLRSQRLAAAWHQISDTWQTTSELDTETARLLSLSQRDLYHALVTLRRIRSDFNVSDFFLSAQNAYSALHLSSMETAVEVARAWKGLPRLLEMRAQKALMYSSKLAGGPWRLLDGWLSSGVCWRYSVLTEFPEQLMSFTDAVRSDGFYISNLYWPLNEIMCPSDSCPNAALFSRRVINLWVDDTVSLSWVERCCDRLNARAKQYASSA